MRCVPDPIPSFNQLLFATAYSDAEYNPIGDLLTARVRATAARGEIIKVGRDEEIAQILPAPTAAASITAGDRCPPTSSRRPPTSQVLERTTERPSATAVPMQVLMRLAAAFAVGGGLQFGVRALRLVAAGRARAGGAVCADSRAAAAPRGASGRGVQAQACTASAPIGCIPACTCSDWCLCGSPPCCRAV